VCGHRFYQKNLGPRMVSKNGRLKRRKNEKERERVKREKMGSGLER